MSRRAVWLAFGALSLGVVVVSCTGSDGDADFDATGGQGAGGDSSSTAGSKTTGGSNADAGAGQGQAGEGAPIGGQTSGNAGSPGGGSDPVGGMPGGGGDATSGGAGGAGDSRAPCASYENCEAGEFCMKQGCDDQKAGVCVASSSASPVCGCDGVTYYDGALASGAGVDVRDRGVCTGDTAVACDGECEEGLTCGQVRLRGSDCVSKIPGVCWQLPKECPVDELASFNVCESEKCLSLCEAVQNATPAVGGGLVCSILANQ